MLFSSLIAGLMLVQGALGSELRKDGYSFRPPAGFRMVRQEPYTGTRAGAVAMDSGAPRFLSAALSDGEGPEAAMLELERLRSVVGWLFAGWPLVVVPFWPLADVGAGHVIKLKR